MVGNDDVESRVFRIFYLFDGGRSRIDRNYKPGAVGFDPVEGLKRKPVALFSVGDIVRDVSAPALKIFIKQRSRSNAVDVIVSVNRYLFIFLTRVFNFFGGFFYIGKKRGVAEGGNVGEKKSLRLANAFAAPVYENTGDRLVNTRRRKSGY